MDIEVLKSRVYFLAGQLEEAKKIYSDAAREIDEANKKQANEATNTAPSTAIGAVSN